MDAVSTACYVKELDRRIDQVFELLRIQNGILWHLLPQSDRISADLKGLSVLEAKLGEIGNALSSLEQSIQLK